MAKIDDQDFRDAIIATKKDAKLVAAAKNERTNSFESMYREFSVLPVDRQREIIGQIASEYFVAGQWKIAFPLNSVPADLLPDAVRALGKALFFSRDDEGLREAARSLKLYSASPLLKSILSIIGDAAEINGDNLARIASILNSADLFGLLHSAEGTPNADLIVQTIGKVAIYTMDEESTMQVARFLAARRYSSTVPEMARLIEDTVFMARDRKAVNQIVEGLSSSPIDVVLQRHGTDKSMLSAIRDVAWKTKNAAAIRNYISSRL
ncbi:MAG TPA: hypothetical protein VFG11_01615 [Acidobacteriota bacterium]|nr:hypothetical protein [Acidobacteriota bacterium]